MGGYFALYLPSHIFRPSITYVRVFACFLYILSILGIPVPRSIWKDKSLPFPCMNRPCGCKTAYQCWTQCRCFTPQQRAVWAWNNNIAIPEFAVLPPPDELAELHAAWLASRNEDKKDCDPQAATDACCCCCCETKPETCRADSEIERSNEIVTSVELAWVMGPINARCQGSVDFESKSPSVPPVPYCHWIPVMLVAYLYPMSPLFEQRFPTPPDPPPPRVLV